PERHGLRALLTDAQGRVPSRRTWERRLAAIPAPLPAQIGCLGRHLVALLQPWTDGARAAAIASTVWRALGGVWHQKDREPGGVGQTSVAPEASWPTWGWRGGVYGWNLPLVCRAARVWIPLAAGLAPANAADTLQAPGLIQALPLALRLLLGDQHDHDPDL